MNSSSEFAFHGLVNDAEKTLVALAILSFHVVPPRTLNPFPIVKFLRVRVETPRIPLLHCNAVLGDVLAFYFFHFLAACDGNDGQFSTFPLFYSSLIITETFSMN
jgi:hypothetical protein